MAASAYRTEDRNLSSRLREAKSCFVMRPALAAFFVVFGTVQRSLACPVCNSALGYEVRSSILEDRYMLNLLWLLLPFGVFGLVASWVYGKGAKVLPELRRRLHIDGGNPFLSAALLLGVGLGGFFDGIVFHQLLQLHNMISARLYPDTLVAADVNMFWDGVFHAFCYTTILAGLVVLWRAVVSRGTRPSGRMFVGVMLVGAGFFNAVEGLIDHQILALHHVVERASGLTQLLFDLGFLASGFVLMGLGGAMISRNCNAVTT